MNFKSIESFENYLDTCEEYPKDGLYQCGEHLIAFSTVSINKSKNGQIIFTKVSKRGFV